MDLPVFSPIVAKAEIKKYTLVGDDIYVKRYSNDAIPNWYKELINDIIATNTTITGLKSTIDYLSTLPNEYNQQISELRDADAVMNTKFESLVTRVGSNTAAIAELDITKVDANSASTIARDTVAAYFNDGSAGSWFDNRISTYASTTAVNAMNISTLASTLDNTTVRIDTVEEVSISQNNQLETLNTKLINVVDNIIPELQSQIDGEISTWFYEGEPTLDNAPANTWTDDNTKLKHIGDLYYDKATGYAYRFAYEDIEDSPNMGMIFSWIKISDVDITKALSDVADAQATADSKATVYNKTVDEINAITNSWTEQQKSDNVGDIWIDTDAENITKIWSGTEWVDMTNTQSNIAYTWSANASKLITSPDGSITGWSFGDSSNEKSYFKIKAETFQISDGTTGYTPFSIENGNINLNGKVNFSNVTEVPQLGSTPDEVVEAINAGNTTTIDGGKITTGSITADKIATDQILVNQTIQSSDFTSVGSGGFRLKANAAGTASDPTIYGAYIKGGVVSGVTLESSTISVRDFILINEAGYPTKPITHKIIPVNNTIDTIWLGLTGVDSTTVSDDCVRCAKVSNNVVIFDGSFGIGVNGDRPRPTVQLRRGTTVLKTLKWQSHYTEDSGDSYYTGTMNGLYFSYIYDDGTDENGEGGGVPYTGWSMSGNLIIDDAYGDGEYNIHFSSPISESTTTMYNSCFCVNM